MALLRWEHQWGGISKKWQEQYELTGKQPPEPYFQKPDLYPESETVLAAFYELGTERQYGAGVGPIPRSKARAYAVEDLDLDPDEVDRFCAIISRVDGEYLAMIAPKRDADGKVMRDIAPVNDPVATRRVLQNLAKKPKAKPKADA